MEWNFDNGVVEVKLKFSFPDGDAVVNIEYTEWEGKTVYEINSYIDELKLRLESAISDFA